MSLKYGEKAGDLPGAHQNVEEYQEVLKKVSQKVCSLRGMVD